MYTNFLIIFAPLFLGYFIPIHNKAHLDKINRITSYMINIILFLMGLSLAGLDNLTQNIQLILKYTLTFFFILSFCNLIILPILDKVMPLPVEQHQNKLPLHKMAFESAQLIFVVLAGLIVGLILSIPSHWVEIASEGILLSLLFFIGIQLRHSGLTLRQILLNKHGLLIALIMFVSSMIGGVLCALLLDLPLFQSLAMSSGFGWYSLSGILIGDAFGPIFGASSFLLELLRELIALTLIPILILRMPNTAIGYAGATAMDFTLPIIQTSGGVRCVPVAIVSGFILSLLVPTFMVFMISLAQITP